MRLKHGVIPVVVLVVFSMTNCCWAKKAIPQGETGAVQGNFIDAEPLRQGGKILIIPFSAGEGVAQTEMLENLALRLVRGLSEALSGQEHLKVLSGEPKIAEADFVIKGRVVRLIEKKGFPSLIGERKIIRELVVNGEVVSRRTGEVLADFSDSQRTTQRAEDFNILAEKEGQRIGAFIAKKVH